MKRQVSLLVIGCLLCALGLVSFPSVSGATPSGSLVSNTSSSIADTTSFQRKSFFASGRYFVFYSDGANIAYKSSLNGIDWNGPTNIKAGYNGGEKFSVWFDGTYVHIVYGTGAVGTHLYYRRGTPNGGGAITWSAEQVAVAGAANKSYTLPVISVDTSVSPGYPWIGYRLVTGGTTYPLVTKSKNNNGTWATATGFPYDLAGWGAAGWVVSPIPLNSGNMVAVYTSFGRVIYARSWKPSSSTPIGGFQTVHANTSAYFSAVGQGDDVNLVFLEGTAIRHTKYSFSTNSLGPENIVQGGLPGTSAPVLSIDSFGDLHLFWAVSPTIYYKQNSGGIWNSTPLSLVTDTEALTSNDRLTSPFNADNGKIVFYMTKSANPFKVKSSLGTAAVAIKKVASKSPAYIGDTITYTITVKNTGKTNLTTVNVTDSAGAPSGPTGDNGDGKLNPGETWTYSFNYTVKQTDSSPLVNTANVSASDGTTSVADTDSCSIQIINPLAVTKTGPLYAFEGAQINFTIKVRNAWDQNINQLSIADTWGDPVYQSGDNGDGILNPGETWVYALGGIPAWSGSILNNTVTVTATGADQRVLSGSDSFNLYPLVIKKDVVGVADDTEFDVWIKDKKKMGLESFKISETTPKKIWLSKTTHWFKEVILYPNCYRLMDNANYVIKYYPQYSSEFAEFSILAGIQGQPTEVTFYNQNLCKVCVEKSGPDTACLGDKIQYNIKVTNCGVAHPRGDTPVLNDVTLMDPLLGLNQNFGTLAVGAFAETSVDYTIKFTDPDPLVNIVTATAKHPMAYEGDLGLPPSGMTTITATATHSVDTEECRKGQICGFKFDDLTGDGQWTPCRKGLVLDFFDNGSLDSWVPIRGTWIEEDDFLKQTDPSAGNPDDPLILYALGDESKKFPVLYYYTQARPVSGNRDFGLVFFAQDESHYYLFKVDGAAGKVGIFRRNGPNYETIIEKPLADVGVPFAVENGEIYKLYVITIPSSDEAVFILAKGDIQPAVFTLPLRETFGCTSGYIGLQTNMSTVDFDYITQSFEPVVVDWQIQLNGPVSQVATTGPDGSYCFYNLPAGTYTVSEVLQPGWEQTFPPSQGTYEISLAAGEAVGCINFGNARVVSISGFKFADCNGDGSAGEGEYGLGGWKISLYKQNGVNWDSVTETMTEPDGYYAFEGLVPGVYKVVEESRQGWENTLPGGGEYIITLGSEPKADLNFGNHWIGAAAVDFIGYDTTTQGFWETQYGSCFYALPNPGAKKDPEWTVGPGWYSSNVGQYNYVDQATGAVLSHEAGARNNPNWAAQFDFRVFDYDNNAQSNAFAWPSKATVNSDGTVKPENYLLDPCSGGYYASVCGAQFKPSLGKYFAVTWDSDLYSKEPLIAEVKINTPGLYRVTFNVINPNDFPDGGGSPYYYEGHRAQDFWLWINGNDVAYGKGSAAWSGHRDPWTGSIYLSFMITAEEPITVSLGAQLTNYCPGSGCPQNAYISGVFVDCICGPQIVKPRVSKDFKLTVTNPEGAPQGVTYWAALSKNSQTWGPVQLTDPDQDGVYTGVPIAGLSQGTYHYRFYYIIDSQETTIQEGDETLNESKTNEACWAWLVSKIFQLTVTNPEAAPPEVKYWANLSNKGHGGSFETTVELTGGPPTYSAAIADLVPGLYGWSVYATWGNPTFTHPITGGNEKLTSNKINDPTLTWPDHYCTYTQGYWKNHPEAWPVDSLFLGTVYYDKSQLLQIFDQSVQGNGLVSLAHQLIAAKLNVAMGAWPPAGIQADIGSADSLIGGFFIPPLGGGYLDPPQTDGLTGDLDTYNKGEYPNGPPHCAD